MSEEKDLAIVGIRGIACLVWCGQASFSVYLAHFSIIATIGATAFDVLFHNTGNYYIASSIAPFIILASLYIPSEVFYQLIDKTSMKI